MTAKWRQFLVRHVLFSLPVCVCAQDRSASDIQSLAEAVAADIEAARSCEVDLIGMPQRDDFSGRWLINFSAAGNECDGLPEYVSEEAGAAGIQFVLRPNRDQINEIVREILHSVRAVFRCQISLDRGPRLNETSARWMVDYRATGRDCDDASEVVRRRGQEYAIVFLRRPNPPTTLQTH